VRAGVAAAAVLGVTAVDAWAGQRAMAAGPRPVRRAITIGRSPWAVYRFWRQLGNLPRFMTRPGLTEIEIVRDEPGQLIGWRSLESAAVHHEGTVRFSPAPDRDGTEILLELRYGAQHGLKAALRSMVEPVAEVVIGTQMEADLSRFKQLMETGDIARAQGGGER
jgi:uncharacterized membrane protein